MDEHDKAVEAAEDQGFEQVDGEGHVFARSSGEVDDSGVKDAPDADPQKDESAAQPVPNTLAPPERHAHSAHEEDAVGTIVDDADFDAEERHEDDA